MAVAIKLSEAERRELEGLARRRKTGQALARRARIVLGAAEGLANKVIAAQVGADANTVGKWRRRFAARGLEGLYDEPHPGAPRQIGDEQVATVIARTLEETPPRMTRAVLMQHHAAAGLARPPPAVRSAPRRPRYQTRALKHALGPHVAQGEAVTVTEMIVEVLHRPAHVAGAVLFEHPLDPIHGDPARRRLAEAAVEQTVEAFGS